MVEKLNQTRQSAMSAQARPGRNMRVSQSIQSPSPYKPMGKDALYTSNQKSKQQFLGDADLNDRD